MEDLRGIDVTDVFSEPDGRRLLLDELHRKGFVKNRILSLKRTDNTPVTVSVTALAEFDKENNLEFINGIVQDILGVVNPGAGQTSLSGRKRELRSASRCSYRRKDTPDIPLHTYQNLTIGCKRIAE